MLASFFPIINVGTHVSPLLERPW